MKARHALELSETQGLDPLLAYHEWRLVPNGGPATKLVLDNIHYKNAISAAKELLGLADGGGSHPKLDVLESVATTFIAEHPASRFIVFTKYRASIASIVGRLQVVPGVVPARFVGQETKSPVDQGINRDEQQETLSRFKAGEFNALVATQAAEEGLDVPDCDLVVCYEATGSVIQSIQRQGRTGRKRAGEVVVLIANGPIDQANVMTLDRKLARLPEVYQHVRRFMSGRSAAANNTPAHTVIRDSRTRENSLP
jgi:Fanconi anemia group M protein